MSVILSLSLFLLFVNAKNPEIKFSFVDDIELPSTAGLKLSVTQKGVNYFTDIGIKILKEQIKKVKIPDITGEVHTPIGSVTYTLSGIELNDLDLPNSEIEIDQGVGLRLVLKDATCSITLDWHYRENSWPHISDSGTAEIDASSVVVSIEFSLKFQVKTKLSIDAKNNRPILSVDSDSVDVQDLDIHLHGGASWLYQIFVDSFSHEIRNAANKALDDEISSNIRKGANHALKTLPIEVPINPMVEINYGLISDPVFGSDYFAFPDAGEFYETSNPQECPSNICSQINIPDVVTEDMVNIIISEYSASSAAFVYFQLGLLQINITNADVPSWAPIKLNTSSFKYIIPELYNFYPNQLMKLVVTASNPPLVQFTSEGASVQLNGTIDCLVVLPNGTLPSVFTIGGEVATSGTFDLQDTTLFGNLTFLKGNFEIVNSNVGDFSITVLNEILNLMFDNGIIPEVNEELKKGIALPSIQGVQFQNSSIVWGEGYTVVSSDIIYTPDLFL